MRNRMLMSAAALALAAGCAGNKPAPQPVKNVAIPAKSAAPAKTEERPTREAPPEPGPGRDYRFPKVVWSDLPSGMGLAVVAQKTAPVVEVRVAVLGGRSADGERTGLAKITGQMLKEGGAGAMSSRDVLSRLEAMGAALAIDTDFDSTVVSLSVPKERMGDALDLVGAMIMKPQMAASSLDKLKRREIERLESAARTDGRWAAQMVLFDELFSLPAEHHPYASYDAKTADIARITVADCHALHKKLFIPKNTFISVVGDITPDEARAAVDKAFAGYRGGEPEAASFTEPMPPESLKITLLDRPKSTTSEIFVGLLGPERGDKSWAAFTVATAVLGGGAAGKIAGDVEGARASMVELGHGPSVLLVEAAVPSAKTGGALEALLGQLERAGRTAPFADEIESAQTALWGSFAVRMESAAALADELVHLRVMGSFDDAEEAYRKELSTITPALSLAAASEKIRVGHEIVVVAGDAEVIGPALSRFGEVKVLDPQKRFERVRTLPMREEANAVEAP